MKVFVIKVLKYLVKILESEKGTRTALVQRGAASVQRDVKRHAHRFVPGTTPITHTWQAMRLAVAYEVRVPRCHVRGQANRYALGYTA